MSGSAFVTALQVVLAAGLLPNLDSPIPESVGFDLPFTYAGYCAIAAGALETRSEERERLIRKWTLRGFVLGWCFLVAVIAAEVA